MPGIATAHRPDRSSRPALPTSRLPTARLLAALVLPLLLLLPLLSPLAHAAEMVSVNRPEINMRAGPGTRHEALWSLIKGYPLEVIGRKGKWYKVRDFEKDTGWIYRPLAGKSPHHIVRVKIANIRSGPGTRYAIAGKAVYGEVLRTIERKRSWVKVGQEDGAVGWVSRKLLWGW